jgi:6-phosphogluconolactonase
MKTIVRRFPDLSAMSREAAAYVAEDLIAAVRRQGRASLVLSGGATPCLLYSMLASEPFVDAIPWALIHFFWGDERCVPSDHADSNFKMANDAMLSRVHRTPLIIHRIKTELGLYEAAAAYEDEIKTFFGEQHGRSTGSPAGLFDLVLLGIGPDGHTASLFPNSPALQETVRLVAAVEAPEGILPRQRITLTLPAISRTRTVLFLSAGRLKFPVVQAILDAGPDALCYPAGQVTAHEKLLWYCADTE